MLSSIELEVPEGLTLVGKRQMAFTIDLVSHLPEGFVASCRLVGDESETQFRGRMAQVKVPPDQVGELMLTLSVEEVVRGRRWEGVFRVPVESKDSVVVYGEGAVVYSAEPARTIGPRRRITIGLQEVARFRPTLLQDLLECEEVVPLDESEDGLIRVLSLHAGSRLIAGRCYAFQLHAGSRRRLLRVGAEQVDWVSAWDDPNVNQVVAQLAYDAAGEQLVVENLTDYSHTPQIVRVIGGGEDSEVTPGNAIRRDLQSGGLLRLEVGAGKRRRQVVKLRFEELSVGHTLCPVFTTEGTRFPFPPLGAERFPYPRNGTERRRMVAYLGAWIALPAQVLEQLLESLTKQTLDIQFLQDKVNLSLSFAAAQRAVVVHSNEDLARGLDLR